MAQPPAFDFRGNTVLVTGASRGLGESVARAFAAAGAAVVLAARGDGAGAVAADLRSGGARAWALSADLSRAASARQLFAHATEAAGAPPDIIVNNAGTIRRHDFVDFPEQDWAEVIETNLASVFRISQEAARAWIPAGTPGVIVNVASLLSFQGGIRVASYAAAKSGLAGLTRALANELAPRGIRVNAVVPGYFATDNTAALRADSRRSGEILGRIPAGRWGEPADLVGAVLFLASPAAAYVHGTLLPVDGGWLAR